MCTVLVLLRPDVRWPLLIGANRDERLDRPFLPPARHWPERPRIIAARDILGGGSWFGVNDDGVVATIVNGMNRLGPLEGKETRGALVLRALESPDAGAAVQAIGGDDPRRYRGFTLLVADRRCAFAIASDEESMRVDALAPGAHMVTPEGCDVLTSPRYVAHFPAFTMAATPNPDRGDWSDWVDLLRHADEDDPHRAMTVVTPHQFGTVSSTLLALPSDPATPPMLLFAAGPPTRAPYEPIATAPLQPAQRDG